jgi:hypothetical protein
VTDQPEVETDIEYDPGLMDYEQRGAQPMVRLPWTPNEEIKRGAEELGR